MVADERLQGLLEAVEQQRETRCAAILAQARDDAQALVKQARGKARTRLHREILHARQQFAQQFALQQASQAASQREARFRSDRALLDQAWPLLRTALERRWQEPVARRRWVEALTDLALARLVADDWRIEHPADWPVEEREALARRVQERSGTQPVFDADTGLQAGIRVRAGNTLVDGSCDGLLRDRVHIEALLLAALREKQLD
jgi:F0F1-type ATP synthase membrane subunit b/b'